jgi:hypothetical protein
MHEGAFQAADFILPLLIGLQKQYIFRTTDRDFAQMLSKTLPGLDRKKTSRKLFIAGV